MSYVVVSKEAACLSVRVHLHRSRSQTYPLSFRKAALFRGITEWFRLEETSKIIQFQPPFHEEGHLLDQVA